MIKWNAVGKMGFPWKEEMRMKTPAWLGTALKGAAVGGVVLAAVGFTWGGWVTGETAREMASKQARLELVAALVPICLEQSKQDPRVVETLAKIKDASSYQRSSLVMDAGWATMPGSSDPNRSVAAECLKKLSAQF